MTTADYFDDDENVKVMREAARVTGLIDLLAKARTATTVKAKDQLLDRALHLVGEPEPEDPRDYGVTTR